jgi:hypothetical protein
MEINDIIYLEAAAPGTSGESFRKRDRQYDNPLWQDSMSLPSRPDTRHGLPDPARLHRAAARTALRFCRSMSMTR